jgi:hypothetical protein
MPEICRFYGIVIIMYFRDHNPPHFHARYGSFKASIEIENMTLMDGFLPPRTMGLIVEWGMKHRKELFKNWDLARERKSISKIDPLE